MPFRNLPRVIAQLLLLAMSAQAASGQCVTQELHGDDTQRLDGYGAAASSAGDVIAVGDARGLTLPGRIWLYRRVAGSWSLETIIDDPLEDPRGYFHIPFTDGEVLLVAALEVSGEDWFGAVHIYRCDGFRWKHEAMLHPDDFSGIGAFGSSLAIKGDVAIIGARNAQVEGLGSAGAAFIYRYDRVTCTWHQEQELHATNPLSEAHFGDSVWFDGERIVVGAYASDHYRGTAYVFRRDGETWSSEAELNAPDATDSDFFGRSVFIDGDFLAVGATRAPSHYGGATGAAYTFVRRDGRWTFEQKLEPSDPIVPFWFFGKPVMRTADGQVLVIGCLGDPMGGQFAGAAYLFRRIDGRWVQTGKVGDPSPNTSSEFLPYSLNGDQLVACALHGGIDGNGVAFVWNGIHQRDCDQDGLVDACEGAAGPIWAVIAAPCRDLSADLDGDGVVGTIDLGLLLAHWGICEQRTPCAGDLDGTRAIDGHDLALLLAAWGGS